MCADVTYNGRCFCGGFKYTCTRKVFKLTNCHCGVCHKATGAAFYTAFDMPRSCITITEATIDTFYESSERVKCHFCNKCGTTIYDEIIAIPDTLVVNVSSLEGYPEASVGVEMFVKYKAPWHL